MARPCCLTTMLAVLSASFLVARSAAAEDTTLQAEVNSLLARMTTAEKARQLVIQDGGSLLSNGVFDPAAASSYLAGVGAGVLDSVGRNVDPTIVNAMQRAVVTSSRFGIGAIMAEECQHGVQGDWHTIFPSPYTVAAAFDTELMEDIGRVIAAEARAGGTTQCWSPVCGLAREPRWGRAEKSWACWRSSARATAGRRCRT